MKPPAGVTPLEDTAGAYLSGRCVRLVALVVKRFDEKNLDGDEVYSSLGELYFSRGDPFSPFFDQALRDPFSVVIGSMSISIEKKWMVVVVPNILQR